MPFSLRMTERVSAATLATVMCALGLPGQAHAEIRYSYTEVAEGYVDLSPGREPALNERGDVAYATTGGGLVLFRDVDQGGNSNPTVLVGGSLLTGEVLSFDVNNQGGVGFSWTPTSTGGPLQALSYYDGASTHMLASTVGAGILAISDVATSDAGQVLAELTFDYGDTTPVLMTGLYAFAPAQAPQPVLEASLSPFRTDVLTDLSFASTGAAAWKSGPVPVMSITPNSFMTLDESNNGLYPLVVSRLNDQGWLAIADEPRSNHPPGLSLFNGTDRVHVGQLLWSNVDKLAINDQNRIIMQGSVRSAAYEPWLRGIFDPADGTPITLIGDEIALGRHRTETIAEIQLASRGFNNREQVLFHAMFEGGTSALLLATPVLAGDFNGDGAVTTEDINPFVMALTADKSYAIAYPSVDVVTIDPNNDGTLDTADINAFIELLTGVGGAAIIPEPAIAVLFSLAMLAALTPRRRCR